VQRQLTFAVIGLWLVLMVPFTWRHLSFVFGGGH
jgi:hypothetical protein